MNTVLLAIPFLILFAVPLAFAENDDFFSTLFGDAVLDNDDEHADDDKDNGWFYGFGIISVDDKGNVYVADMAKHRIQKFSHTGEFLTKWGSTGTEDGQFALPTRIAFDSAGDLFVADADNNRIQKFTSTGEFLETLDGFGEIGVQQIIHTEIAIDSEDNIYSLDVQSLSVHKISSAGKVLAEWELYPDEEEPKISTPHILSIDSDDNVYVADSHRIHVFSSDGELISKFDTFGTITDGSTDANPLAIDVSGNTYVRDWDDGAIKVFSRDGIKSPSQKFAALTSQEPARFAIGVTLDVEGNLYAFDVLDFNVKKFDSDGNIVASFGERATEPIVHDQITYPESMAFDSEDNLYVESENRIFKFASDGKIIEKMKLVAGNDDDEVTQISDIAFDSSDDMYVSNEKNRMIKFTNDGEFIEEYDMTQTSVSEFYLDSMRMSMDGKNNNIYVVGRIASPDNAVQKFSSDGRFITSWNHDHDGSERDQSAMIPTAVITDHDENVYVAYYPSLIQKFSSDGEFLAELRSPQKDVQFLDISAMAVDSDNNLYVADVNPHKIIKFSQDGKFIADWGSTGHDKGQFFATSGIAVDSKDDVYVADTGNKRIQKFFKDSIVSEHSDTSQADVDVSPENDLSGQLLPSPSINADDSTQDEELSQTQDILDSPLKQYKSETNANKIQCRESLVLVIKYDGSPACVKSETKTILVERGNGWTANIGIHDAEFKDTESETLEIPLSVYPRFDNEVTEIINSDHEPLRYRNTIQVIDDTYLSKNVQQWSDASPDELQAEPKKYDGDEFYTELGRLLMKNEMQYQMNELGIINVQDDFEVISGMSLDSLPPHIGFSSIIHATDGHYYWLQGGTHANQVNYYKTTQLQYPNPTETGFGSSRVSQDVIPQISIVQKAGDGENDLKSVPSSTVLHQLGDVEFYNDAPGTLTVYLTKDGLEEFSFENSQKIVIQSKSDAVWSFADPGSYSWRGMVPIMIDGNEYELHTGGGVLVLSDDMSDLSKEEKMETARMMLITSSLPINGIGQQGEEDTLFIHLSPAINELLPESKQYYLEMAQKVIPFDDISITLDDK